MTATPLLNVFDTAAFSDNLGDEIIMDSVWDVLHEIMPGQPIHCTPSHRRATLCELRAGRQARLSIVGGTNILKSHMLVRGNWKITPLDYLAWRNVVVLGVGWQQYGGDVDLPTKLFLNTVMSPHHLQSVRDPHTFTMLSPILPNTIYTACPTMWGLDEAHCARIPKHKAQDVIFAVTYYRPAPEADLHLLDILKKNYRRVFFWPQQDGDLAYARDCGMTGMTQIEPKVSAYNDVLDNEDVDFVGARLHGGIRALQRLRRGLIIPVDNRALEMGSSTNLPVISRDEPEAITHWINTPAPTRLVLPWDAIARWKGQFSNAA